MSNESQSIPPPERVNILMPKPADGSQGEELPLRLAVVGDFAAKADDTPIAERKVVDVNQKNYNEVMAAMDIVASFSVKNKIAGREDEEFPVELRIDSMQSFRPENVAGQVPQIKQLLDLRQRLNDLKSIAQKDPNMARRLNELLKNVWESLSEHEQESK